MFKDILEYIKPGTVLVLNDSKVRKARLFARSETGGTVEFLMVEKKEQNTWTCIVNKSAKQRIGKSYTFPGNVFGTIIDSMGKSQRVIRFSQNIDDQYFDIHGHIPLPPYINRPDTKEDEIRYQTVYSEKMGSIASPTAGLHFTEEIISKLIHNNVIVTYLTLHVGIGTFMPIRTEDIEDHTMHEEEYEISKETAHDINTAKKEGRKICAVGTTTIRALESSWKNNAVQSEKRRTQLYIRPGYTFKVIDSMITNFHTPESTLLVLVSAFAGKEAIRKAYREAIEKKYAFFSYGDSMFITEPLEGMPN
jgi:S-adenosylmethionine:tRNA ribosyltransferase-isomerase